ncbi:MAG: hypothetical protein JOZ98_13320 [Solirubrobacterales bacterium]|nr:hypothetical protein [Solirubrobacterales bacterium]
MVDRLESNDSPRRETRREARRETRRETHDPAPGASRRELLLASGAGDAEEGQARAITLLAGGSLTDEDRRNAEAWLDGRPELWRDVASQRRVARELRTGGPAVPERLVRAVEARLAADGRRRSRRVSWTERGVG